MSLCADPPSSVGFSWVELYVNFVSEYFLLFTKMPVCIYKLFLVHLQYVQYESFVNVFSQFHILAGYATVDLQDLLSLKLFVNCVCYNIYLHVRMYNFQHVWGTGGMDLN